MFLLSVAAPASVPVLFCAAKIEHFHPSVNGGIQLLAAL
jgi:hypothetical protein